MNRFNLFLKKLPYKFIAINLFFIAMLFVLYISHNISLLTTGFLFDLLFIIGFISLLYFAIGSNLAKNIVFTVLGSILSILFIADHIYYSNFHKFASISSLNNLGMAIDNAEAYGISLDFIGILHLFILAGLIVFLFMFKEENIKFKKRIFYSIPALLVFVPFVATYIMAYNDITLLDLMLFPKRYKFPDFVSNFGYLIYRYEDIAVQIDLKIGG